MMKLYSFAGSCALATHIVLEWTGEPYTLNMVQKEDLSKPAYLKLNPNGQVPLITDGDWVLFENAAILNYLADRHPESHLGGDGTPKARAEINRWLGLLNSDMHPAFKPLFGATGYLDDAAAIAKTQENARQRLRTYFEEVDGQLSQHEWVAGSTRSIVDPYLFVMLRWAKAVKVDTSGLEHLKQFEHRMRADGGVQKALRAQGLDQAV